MPKVSQPQPQANVARKMNEPIPVSTIPNPFRRWCDIHGAFVLSMDGTAYFEDGSVVHGKDSPGLTTWREPPIDPIRLLEAKRYYLGLKLGKERRGFDQFKKDCSEQLKFNRQIPGMCPRPRADSAAQLRAGQKRIAALLEQIAAIDKELADTPEGQREKEVRQANAERNAEITRQHSEILGINSL